ncbi:TPA: acyltransferase family protein, partial [Yersinia enterocolitica]|nr:acyltransferase family protein [Yersinia enterocolitica]
MKIIFANQLRGIAAIMVVMSHYLGSFFYRQDLVSARIGSDSIPINKPWYADFILNIPLNSFNFGPLGVSIFFLISGFVILFSL